MSKFSLNIDKGSSTWQVKITGTIDEDVDFSLYPLTGATHIDLLLNDIKSINSCGIREWIKWIGGAGQVPVVYHECPKIIVDQINMVQGFLPGLGKVQSFYVPYYSEESGNEKNVLFTNGKEFDEAGGLHVPSIKDESGEEMEMDVVEAKYFKFLKK